MFFCPFCRNILLIEEGENYYLFCQLCKEYTYNLNYKSRIIDFKIDNQERILNKEDEFKYSSICEKLCKCGNNKAAYYELQTRSADEPMTIFYQCTKCKKVTKE